MPAKKTTTAPKKKAAKKKSAKKKAAKKKAAPRKRSASTVKAGSGKNLVIVESPAKAKTINKYLGSDYVVKASMGHVRDLPSKKFGFEPDEDNYDADYEIIPSKKKVVAELRKLAKAAPRVYLATDLDREGEAIAWHLAEALKVPAERQARVVFNQITKKAIKAAFDKPGEIDTHMVDAQQARRFLDRMMGYKLSPLLWRRAGPGLSAGRVQTVALRLIVEKEREIRAFIPEVYWTVEARFAKEGSPPTPPAPEPEEDGAEPGKPPVGEGEFLATLVRVNDEKIRITDEKVGTDLLERLAKADFRIAKVVKERKKERPSPPFTTSTMQQTAATRMRFSAKRTMGVAQRLYQGVELGKEGQVALITYMRTDSVALSSDAIEDGRRFIAGEYGDAYLPEKPNFYKSGKRAQEAHEAIRPTDPARTPQMIQGLVGDDEFRLYDLIWRRFMACQMTPAETDVTTVAIEAEGCTFESRGRTPAFDGWRRVLPQKKKEEAVLPPLDEGEKVEDRGVTSDRHETQPPPRFTEASLVRTLEKEGIGRPSTYAAIISTIVDRNYVLKERAKFRPTALGEVVNDLLVPFFEDILHPKYTSRMEEELDEVEDAKIPWKKVLKDFWKDFSKDLARAEKDMKPLKFLPAPEGTDPCEKCGSDMVRKIWKGSEFLGCSKYPDCKNTRKTAADGTPLPPPEETDHVCKKCEKPMVIRTGRRGRFLACTGYPDCKNTADVDDDGKPIELPEVNEKCEKCDSDMVAKMGRRGPFMACSGYPKCKNAKDLPGFKKAEPKEAGADCPDCGKPMQIRMSRRGPFAGCTAYPKCKKTLSMDKLAALKAGG